MEENCRWKNLKEIDTEKLAEVLSENYCHFYWWNAHAKKGLYDHSLYSFASSIFFSSWKKSSCKNESVSLQNEMNALWKHLIQWMYILITVEVITRDAFAWCAWKTAFNHIISIERCRITNIILSIKVCFRLWALLRNGFWADFIRHGCRCCYCRCF